MSIKAPYAKHKKTNFKIFIAVCIGLALWCVYDGYINEDWIQKHTNEDGSPGTYLVFNRQAPYYFFGAAVLLAVYMSVAIRRRVVAEENELNINGKERIAYHSIKKIDKTYFDKKGYFIITHDKDDGQEALRKISDNDYDNLPAILEHLVEKIS
ncbi:MAG: hypothetical protein ACYTEE_10190 [Planctomycetota bacterium]|jgi:hypothetical protein